MDGNNDPVDISTLSDNKAAYNGIKAVRRDLSSDPPTLTPFPSSSGNFAESDEQLD